MPSLIAANTAVSFLVLNDLHLEFGQPYEPIKTGYDAVILAGDIHTRERGVTWAAQHFHTPVFYVRGNHESYNDHWEKNLSRLRAAAEGTCVTILDHESVIFKGIRLLGLTGWSNFKIAGDRRDEAIAKAGGGRSIYGGGMTDYRKIRTSSYRKLLPKDTVAAALRAENWLQDHLEKPFEGPTVVITHHAPSIRSLPGECLSDLLDAADANPWDHLIAQTTAWVHGQTHHPTHYKVGNDPNKGWVYTNPRGYPGQDLAHNPSGILAIDPHSHVVSLSPPPLVKRSPMHPR